MMNKLLRKMTYPYSVLRKKFWGGVKKIQLYLVSFIAMYNSRKGLLAVNISNDIGIGAKLEWCLEIMAYCDENNLLPQFKFSYPDSGKNEDYFGSFFSIKGIEGKVGSIRFITIHDIKELGFDKNYDELLSIDLATYLIDKYLHINKDVINEVDEFCSNHFQNKTVLGVHYRGTDKVREAPFVSYDKAKRNVEYYLEKFPETSCVFVATDDLNFITYMENASIGKPIIVRNDSFRSQDGNAIHHLKCINRYDMNRDAIINCLILSRCDALLKSASILSDWSKLLNPQLALVILNRPHDNFLWFPARELLQEVLYEPIE